MAPIGALREVQEFPAHNGCFGIDPEPQHRTPPPAKIPSVAAGFFRVLTISMAATRSGLTEYQGFIRQYRILGPIFLIADRATVFDAVTFGQHTGHGIAFIKARHGYEEFCFSNSTSSVSGR